MTASHNDAGYKPLLPPSDPNASLMPLDIIEGFNVRPGFHGINGATVMHGGVNFTVHTHYGTSCELLLFHRTEREPYAILKFPDHYRIGNVFSMLVFGLKITEFEYAYRVDGPYNPEKGLIFDKSRYLLDPYAKAVTGQSEWGTNPPEGGFVYKARVVKDDFDWGICNQPAIPLKDLVIYEMHVRGFTAHESARVEYPGTFAGIAEKIPYLLDLGVNAIELMPIFEFDEFQDHRTVDGKKLINYWGYSSVCFFAPNTSYTATIEYNREGNELKTLIKLLRENGIEVILDVVFNHTAEGNEDGPFFSFKGFDNSIYYLLTPDGKYYNFSGCGNTLNCNNPIVQQMIVECLRHWVIDYRVSGFRFDLASILGRSEDGTPMANPPLLQRIAFDPILGNVKLIAEAWDAGGLYQVGTFPSWNRWAEWNGKYRDDMRSFLKGDHGYAQAAAMRIAGSTDIYDEKIRGDEVSVNFIDCHDGFTLRDLYSYQEKHNEANGWNNTDGTNDNRSWNCGVEGETGDPAVVALRHRLIKNAFAVLLCSRGTPMFFAGDEFGNTQFGNNNAYCQDNEISWLDWGLLSECTDLYGFFKYMIRFRKAHPVTRGKTTPSSCGFGDVTFHSNTPFVQKLSEESYYAGVMFAGRNDGEDDIVYIGINAHWEGTEVALPELPPARCWSVAVDTGALEGNGCYNDAEMPVASGKKLRIAHRSVVILVAKRR